MPPVKMTRAEYQAKYGAAPAANPAPAKVKAPASSTPVQMTRAQYQSTYGTAPSVPKPVTPPKKDGLLETIIKDPIETLLVKPADRVAEVAGRTGIFGKTIKRGYEAMADAGESRRLFGFDVEAQRAFGDGGAKQIGGEALKSASYLYGGGAAPAAVKATLGGAARQGAVRLGTTGALTGGAYAAGDEMTNKDSTLGSILTQGAVGAGLGLATGGVLGAAAPVVAKALSPAEKALRRSAAAKDAMARIVQGAGAKGSRSTDQATGARAFRELADVDLEDVQSSADLANRIDEKISDIQKAKKDVLKTEGTRRTIPYLDHVVEVNGQRVRTNYVVDALDQLEKHYVKSNNPAKAALVRQIRERAQKVGLTVDEIDNIAIMHGQDLSAFNPMTGRLSSGAAKDAIENTRAGLKTTSRNLFGNDVSKEADRAISDLIRVKKLVADRAEKVAALKANVLPTPMSAKLGGLLEQVINIATLGSSRSLFNAIASKALQQAGGVAKTGANALDLEKRLAKDLKLIQEASQAGASEQTIIQKLEQFIKNNETLLLPEGKPTPTLFTTPAGKTSANMQEAIDVAATETGRARPTKTDRRLKSYLTKTQQAQDAQGFYTPGGQLPTISTGSIPRRPDTLPVIKAGGKKPKKLTDIYID